MQGDAAQMKFKAALALLYVFLPLRAQAAEWQTLTLPTFAGNSFTSNSFAPQAVGNSLFATRPIVPFGYTGGSLFSNGTSLGYAGKIDDKVLLGIQSSSGNFPFALSGTPLNTVEYSATNVRLGYDMGKFTPYVASSIATAKPAFGPGAGFTSPFEINTNLQNPAFNQRTSASVGAGFNYSVTDNIHIGAGVNIGNNRGFSGQ